MYVSDVKENTSCIVHGCSYSSVLHPSLPLLFCLICYSCFAHPVKYIQLVSLVPFHEQVLRFIASLIPVCYSFSQVEPLSVNEYRLNVTKTKTMCFAT